MITLAIVIGSIVGYGFAAVAVQRRLQWYFSDPIDGPMVSALLAWVFLPFGMALLLHLTLFKPKNNRDWTIPPRRERKVLELKELEEENRRLERELHIVKELPTYYSQYDR